MGRRVAALLVALAVAAGCTAVRDERHLQATPADTSPDAGLSEPMADPIYPDFGNPAIDVLRYQLDLAWAPEPRELSGTATLTLRATTAINEIALDFSDVYTVDATIVNGAAERSRRRGNDIVVPAVLAKDARTTLVVRYHGTPKSVPMPSGRTDLGEGVGLRAAPDGEAWTMQEPYGAFTWYPANDQPSDEAVYDVAVTVPKGWAAVAHGQLMGIETAGSGETYRFRAVDPVATYLATLAVGRYTMRPDTGPRGLPIAYWLRTGKDDAVEPALRRTPELLAWLEERFGPYPFPTAGVVLVNSLSAMETQQMVTYGVRLSRSMPALDTIEQILLHEFAHQWFGDSVTPTNWRGMWLNEGFAMYAEWLWTVDKGRNSLANWVKWGRERDERSRPVAGPPGNPHPAHFGENNVYAGPALMLHEIHKAIGDQAFFAMARDWVQTQRNQQVDRDRFVSFVNRHTGRDFTNLITAWLDSPTTPA